MAFVVTHRGQALNQKQLEIVTEVMNKHMRGEISQARFIQACDEALEAAGHPVDTTLPAHAECKCADDSK